MRGSRELYGNSILDIFEVYKRPAKITAGGFVIFLLLETILLYTIVNANEDGY
jgi:hypothetical protein